MLKERDSMLKEQAVDIIQSINALQARYDELQALNVSLEQKVEARTTELKAANERLQELDKLKDRFLANISHELRTPLVALSSTLQLITRQQVAEPQAQQALLASSQDSLEDMLENVNDLLLKTRSEKAMLEMRWSRIEIGAFVQTLVQMFDGMAQKSGIGLRFDNCLGRPLPLYVDRAKLKKILNNLLGNALKFATAEVVVAAASDGAHCLLSVRDDGPGIPEGEQEAIFKPFFQASNNPYRDVQGTGIGLSLVNDLVRMHQGEVQLMSRLGQGSRFTVRLPLGEAHVDWEHMEEEAAWSIGTGPLQRGLRRFEELDLAPFAQQQQSGRPTILLVEDNPHIVQVLAHILQPHYNLLFAGDGQDGLELARANRPDLIVSDIMMPRLDGFGLLREVRTDPALKNIPLILLTSKADYASRLSGFDAGADEYLAKPFDNEELLVRIKGLLNRRYFQAELFHLNKIIAVGQMAAGIAHEINNPLSYAQSAAVTIGKILGTMDEDAPRLDMLRREKNIRLLSAAAGRVQDGTARIAAITEALRGFVRPGSAGFQPYDVHEGIEATLKIIHANHDGQITFRCQYDLDEKVECNVNQFNQVLMNVLQNAVQAVAGQPEQEIAIATFRQGDMAHLHIQDNGPGIPKAHLERIFEPFFTTKPRGQGMGLGLHISQQIVQEHGGSLALESRAGAGALCKISLPIHHKGESYEPVRYTHPSVDQRLEGTRYPHR